MFISLILSGCNNHSMVQKSAFGPVDMSDPLLYDINNSKAVQRIKNIDQSGTPHYYNQTPALSRYDHSLGVMYIVQRYGGNRLEQAAALTHDASHTAFSHIADVLFEFEGYQDHIHEAALANMGLDDVLKKHNLTLAEINPDQKHFKRQEQLLPDLCADRIEYNLHTAITYNLLTDDDIAKILSNLRFDTHYNQWYFTDTESAKKFSKLPLVFTKHFWGSKENLYIYRLTSKMLKRALNLGLIHCNQFHYGTDPEIIDILNASDDAEIKFYREHIKKVSMKDLIRPPFQPDLKGVLTKTLQIYPKFRGVDPYVMTKGKLKRLTTLDKDFKKEYETLKKDVKKGHKIIIPLFKNE